MVWLFTRARVFAILVFYSYYYGEIEYINRGNLKRSHINWHDKSVFWILKSKRINRLALPGKISRIVWHFLEGFEFIVLFYKLRRCFKINSLRDKNPQVLVEVDATRSRADDAGQEKRGS